MTTAHLQHEQGDRVRLPGEAQQLRVVCLGASAGGLEALGEFFDALPLNTGAAYVVIVHLSPDFKSLMPELLAKRTPMPVAPGHDGADLRRDHVYIIPPGSNMLVRDGKLHLEAQDRRPGHTLNLPIDLFLQSLAKDSGANSVAIILSGTGSDGSRGIRSIKETGGIVFAQAFSTAKFDGMLVSAAQTGLVDALGAPSELALRVAKLLAHEQPLIVEHPDDAADSVQLSELLELLAKHGPDLSYLRPNMVLRRVQRRMTITGYAGLDAYVAHLREDACECAVLSSDLLIGVTHFFREPETLEVLKTQVLPKLLMLVPPEETLRIWVSACSTGQEVYTIVMLLLETMELTGLERELKVFATDVDERALHRGSRGAYTMSEVADIRPSLLSRYFEQREGQFVVRPNLRRNVIFARHNVVSDPPFTKMDLITCRNLLIYLRPAIQRQVLSSFYQALQPARGVLMLGMAEDVGSLDVSFPPLNRKAKLFSRGGPAPEDMSDRPLLREPSPVIRVDAPPGRRTEVTVADNQSKLLRAALELSSEAEQRSAALVDLNNLLQDVLTDPLGVFRLPKGRPTQDLARILPSPLVTALLAARQRLEQGGEHANLVVPVEDGTAYQLMLRKLTTVSDIAEQSLLFIQKLDNPTEGVPAESIVLGSTERIAHLEQELRQTKESLQATIEELQSSNEEQQSTNEELVASNEELQSTNEELHSVNEELYTVNAEYRKRNEELLIVTADLDNLLRSTSVATLYLDVHLRVRRFTATVTRVIPLRESDIGRSIRDFTHQLDVDLADEADRVRNTGETVEREVRDRRGAWLLLRSSRYESASGEGQGVLMTFIDVTRIKNAEETARVMGNQLGNSNALLAEQTRELEDLFATIARDIQRPTEGLGQKLESMADCISRGDNEAAGAQLRTAFESLSTLSNILRDFTALSRQARTDVERVNVELAPWLDDLLQPLLERAQREHIRLHWACDGTRGFFSRAAASAALGNLIENALMRCAVSEQRRVDVLCQLEENVVRLVVADTGPGIASDEQDKVFMLSQASPSLGTPVLGVRLVAARRMAWRAEGALRLESEGGNGARFILELPNGACTSVRRGIPEIVSAKTVLLVEDDSVDAKRVRLALPDCEIMSVETLAEAARQVQEARYGLIILDLSLPDGHGLGLLGAMQHGRNRNTPVIVVTGHSAGLDRNSLRSTNVVASIDKDIFADAELHQLVDRYVGVTV